MTNPDLVRFGRIVRARREELGIQQEDLDQYGGPSSTTLSRIERGVAAPSAKTLRKLDTGLSWSPGSAKTTLDGGEPKSLPPAGLSRIDIAHAIAAAPATPFDDHFERAERLLSHAHAAVRHGDHLSAIHGLEGAQSTVELLLDRITDAAVTHREKGAEYGVEDAAESATSPNGDEDEEGDSAEEPEVADGATRLDRHLSREGLGLEQPDGRNQQRG